MTALVLASGLRAGGFEVDFERHEAGTLYSRAAAERDWPALGWNQLGRVSVEKSGSGRVLRVRYPEGKIGSAESGAQLLAKFDPSIEASLSYRFRFGDSKGGRWDFSKGGKLPGLGGGACNTGGRRATGDGWSARFMWREEGRLFVYLYHVDQPKKWGEYLDLDFQAKPGEWVEIREQIRVNEGERRNGLLRVWINGKLRLQRDDLRFALGDRAPVSAVLFSTFYGGGTRSWAPARDSEAFFDDFRVELPAVIKPHPDAKANTHSPGEVDDPDLVPFTVGDPADLPGIVIDETEAELVGEWAYSTHTPPYVGIGYLHDQKTGKGEKSATYRPDFMEAGRYEVRLAHCSNVRRSTRVPVVIRHADGESRVLVDMQDPAPHGKLFKTIGRFRFAAGESGAVVIETGGTEPDKVVIADAVQFLRWEE